MIIVVNKATYRGPGIAVTRPSILGNPFVIGKHGTRPEVIERHRHYLWDCLQGNNQVSEEIMKLVRRHQAGEDLILICCCDPEDCHAQTIKRAILWLSDKLPQ